ncbi:ferric-chelate reductase Frp1 [Madurella fahalii]|uniref:ferric-chelate reductase (NADPH) n=1 Tax=Madurella fahalii TaxID=1157608 RepID=A0ABQ0GQ43_9PEZI
MDHSHGGTGMSAFQPVNVDLARRFWYIVAGFVGALVACRAVNFYKSQTRLRRQAANSLQFPTQPSNAVLAIWATLTAIVREASGPQLYIPVRGLSWLTPPPLGRVILLLAYWAVIMYMMTAGAVVKDVFFWERIGFRNAWVTITQVPLLYLLASKCSIIGLIAGTSHERLNWLHRWVGRTMLVTASVHGWHFYTDWARADFVDYQIGMMPMIKYGFGAWGVLLWSLVSGLAPLRGMAYEFFVLQHLVSAVLFLWLIYVHVPSSARYNVWFSVAVLCFDRACRIVLLVWQNVKLLPDKSRCSGGRRIGHQAQLSVVGGSITVVTIKDVHFRWRAGQHLYLWMPRVGFAEAHPYTIACAHQLPGTCICNSIQLVVRKHNGFSQRLHRFAAKTQATGEKENVTVFVSGPYGSPPRWDVYETIILISASTGASFTLPILESLLQSTATNCVKRVDFLLVAKRGDEIDFYVSRLHELIELAKGTDVQLNAHIAVTQGLSPAKSESDRACTRIQAVDPSPSVSSSGSTFGKQMDEKIRGRLSGDVERTAPENARERPSNSSAGSHIFHSSVRPDVAAFIRGPVEAAGGETSVVVCGGPSLVAKVRNCVVALSDERAVHKGTGAQGIHLFAETYSF